MSTLHSLVQNANTDPNRICLLGTDGSTLSIGQLLSRIVAFSSHLRKLGLSRESVVGVSVPNGWELASTLLSVSCSAICAPLSSDDPEPEFERNAKSLGLNALVVANRQTNPHAGFADRLGIQVIALDEIPSGSDMVLDHPPVPEQTALLFSTSGSTSSPKIVPLSHANVAHAAIETGRSLHLSEIDRSLNVLSLIHIHGFVGGLLACLSAGGSVVCAPKFEGAQFFGWLTQFAPTYMTAVPTIHREIVTLAGQHPGRAKNHSLRFVRSASAPMTVDLADSVEEAIGVPMLVSYGMTEASPLISSASPAPGGIKRGSVGKPAGAEVRIMPDNGHVGEAFEEGEIQVRGTGLFSGYLGDAETGRHWSDDGWFCTGDLGYFDGEGFLFVTGRVTEIINRGGSKVSPARIDEVAVRHPDVAEAASFPEDHPTLGQDVVCAIVLDTGSQVKESDLLEFLGNQLPASHQPSRILIVPEIPRSDTGKLKRRTLSDHFQKLAESSNSESDSDSPEGLFGKVAAVWEEMLEESVTADSNFFASGGDSLIMIRCLAELNEILDTSIPLDLFLESPNLGEFVKNLESELDLDVESFASQES